MPLAAEIDQALAEGREDMYGLFEDIVRITRAAPGGGKGTFNETTGQYESKPARVLVYEGPGRMQVKADINSNVVEATAGDREATYLTGQAQLPAVTPTGDDRFVGGSVEDVDVDNIIEWVSAPHSASLQGTFWNVAGPYFKTQAVYLRFRVRLVVG